MKVEKENRNIKVPEQLRQQKQFSIKISNNNQKLFDHIQCLRALVQKIHETYANMSKSILKLSEGFQKKMLNYKDATSMCIINFIRGINTIHLNISNQVNNNAVALNTKTYKITKTRKQIIAQKLKKINQLVHTYLNQVDLYNQKDQRYVNKSRYFEDYQEDVIKYYSITQNNEMHSKLLQKQRTLQQILQKTYTSKVQIKSGLVQLKVSLKQFFQMIKNNVQQYKKLLAIIRKKINITKFFNESVIEQVSSEAQQSVRNSQFNQKNNEKQKYQQDSIIEDRKQINNQFQSQLQAEQILYQFIHSLKKQIQNAGLNIDSIRQQNQYVKIDDRKLDMADLLSQDLLANIKSIKDEIANFRQIILRINNYFQDIKILQQLKKYRKHKFQMFLSDTDPLCDLCKKNPNSSAAISQYKFLKSKFQQNNRFHMSKFRQIVIRLFEKISQQYKIKATSQILVNKNIDIFSKKPLSILIIPFFSCKQQSPPKFQSCLQMKKYNRLMITNQTQKISLDIMSDHSVETNKKKQKSKTGCCGLLCFGGDKKESKIFQKFNCALKKGILLIQGKLNLHQNYVGFISIFNPNNIFFNSCDIRIPKWDIIQIKKGTYLLSILITILTTHGQIEFTSFLNDPINIMQQLYANRNAAVAIIQNKKTQRCSIRQIQVLQQKFQSQLPILIIKQQFVIQSLSTYLSQDKKNLLISVQYHQADSTEKHFFQVKIAELGQSIKYQFVHQNTVKDINIKENLQKIAISIINEKPQKSLKISTTPKNKKTNQEKKKKYDYDEFIDSVQSCSFIQKKEDNQFSFIEQPNFLYRMQENNQAHQGQPSFNFTPDLQIFKKCDGNDLTTKRMIKSHKNSLSLEQQNKYEQNKSNVLSQKNKSGKQLQKTLQKFQQKKSKQKNNVFDSVNTQSVFSTKSRQESKIKVKNTNMQQPSATTDKPHNMSLVLYLLGGVIIINMILSIFK